MRSPVILGLGAFCAVALGGCAASPPAGDSSLAAAANQPVTCTQGDDCNVRWGRALQWVKSNTGLQVTQATGMLIQTAGPIPGNPDAAFSVTKIDQGGGFYAIKLDYSCGEADDSNCTPAPLQARANFNNFVNGPVATAAPPSVVIMASAPPPPPPPPGSMAAPALGISFEGVTPSLAQDDGLGSPRGALVVGAANSGTAARAGIVQGDVILSYDNRLIYTPDDLAAAAAAAPPGSQVPVTLWRGGQQITLSLQT